MGSAPDVYASLKEQLKDSGAEVILPSDGEKYAQSIKRWSEHCEKKAAAVVKPTCANDITTTLSFIREHKIPFVVRGGGHSTSGSASIEDGLVIDLGLMRKVTVDAESKTIRAEGGTTWEDVDVEAAKFGLATVGGTVNHTGVGGLTLGGGYGYLTGKYGLTIDNLVSVEIVLASGEQVVASESENADLFWAVRGAGQNFGVTTAFTFKGHPQPHPVYAGPLIFTPDKLPQIVSFANTFHAKNDGNQALLWGFSSPPPANAPVILAQCFYNGPLEAGTAFFQPLADVGPIADLRAMVPYEKVNTLLNHAAGWDGRKMFGGGAFKLPLDAGAVQTLYDDFSSFVGAHERMGESMVLFETIPYGKVGTVTNEATAFSNRGEYYNLAVLWKWFDAGLDSEIREFSRDMLTRASQSAGVAQDEGTRAVEGVGMYGNYANADVPAETVYGKNAKKLLDLKTKYDPDNLFNKGTRLVPRPLVVVN